MSCCKFNRVYNYLNPKDIKQFTSSIDDNIKILKNHPLIINYTKPYYNIQQFRKYKRIFGDGFVVVPNGSSLDAILELDKRLTHVNIPELLHYSFVNGVYVPSYFNPINKIQAMNMIYYNLPVKIN